MENRNGSFSENKEQPFFVRGKEDLQKLSEWLNKKNYNCGGYITDDKKGNPMYNIGYVHNPDDERARADKRGLIIVIDADQCESVEQLINAHLKKERVLRTR